MLKTSKFVCYLLVFCTFHFALAGGSGDLGDNISSDYSSPFNKSIGREIFSASNQKAQALDFDRFLNFYNSQNEAQRLVDSIKDFQIEFLLETLIPKLTELISTLESHEMRRSRVMWFLGKVMAKLKHESLGLQANREDNIKKAAIERSVEIVTHRLWPIVLDSHFSQEERIEAVRVLEICSLYHPARTPYWDSWRFISRKLSVLNEKDISPLLEVALMEFEGLRMINSSVAQYLIEAVKNDGNIDRYREVLSLGIKLLAKLVAKTHLTLGDITENLGISLQLNRPDLEQNNGELSKNFQEELEFLFLDHWVELQSENNNKKFDDYPHQTNNIESEVLQNLAQTQRQLIRAQRNRYFLKIELLKKGIMISDDATDADLLKMAKEAGIETEIHMTPQSRQGVEGRDLDLQINIRGPFQKRGTEGGHYYGGLGRK